MVSHDDVKLASGDLFANRAGDGFGDTVDLQLAIHTATVSAHRVDADIQPGGDRRSR